MIDPPMRTQEETALRDTMTTQDDPTDDARRRRIRRSTVVLVLVALGIYVTFIVSSVMQARP